MRSRLLDNGREYVDVYPEITVIDDRGIPMRVPSDTPVRVRVTTVAERSSIADLHGQIDSVVVKCFARDAPVASWAKVVYMGEEYDLAAPPRFSPGVSRATRHVEFILRSRAGLGKGSP